MSKVCVKCGAELEEDAVFCDECGAAQEAAPMQNGSGAEVQKKKVKEAIPREKENGFAMASFMLGIISVCTFGGFLIPQILAVVFGLAGKEKQSKFALAGLIMGSIFVGLNILSIILVIVLAALGYI